MSEGRSRPGHARPSPRGPGAPASEARDEILARLEAAGPLPAAAPRRVPPPPMPEDPIGALRARVEQAGGRLQRLSARGAFGEIDWPLPLAATRHVYSAHAALASRGVGRPARDPGPDTAPDRSLAALELCVLRASLAVVENGAVWHVPASPFERAAALLAEHLVVVVPDSGLVASLHQAYERIRLDELAFGWLLCGPSKTADIEQALVFGAHGPRSFRLVLEPD